MTNAVIAGTGLFTPEESISNEELVSSFNAYVDLQNQANAAAIEAGEVEPLGYSSPEFIYKASGINSRFVLDKKGVLDPTRMYPEFRQRSDDEPSLMAEIAVPAIEQALAQANRDAASIDLIIVAASNMERAYPAMAIEIQSLIGAGGFAFDMNVACSSATFGIQAAADQIKAGSIKRALIVNPEITSGHLEWRDRDCHFIFGDVCTATLLEAKDEANPDHFEILSTRCATSFSNNIRNNNGFLRRTRPDGLKDRRDMQFMQNGRKVFKEVLPMVSAHMEEHLKSENLKGTNLKRIWLHQANQAMNDYIGKKVLGRTPSEEEQPNILKDYANTSSAGSIIAFAKYHQGFEKGEHGMICSFGAGYSVGSVLIQKQAKNSFEQ